MSHPLSQAIQLAGLVLSLGFDTLAVAVGLGLAGLAPRAVLRYGIAFALAEGCMPIVGFLAGHAIQGALGNLASYAAILLLLGVGLYALREALEGERIDYVSTAFFPVIATALSVSLDELAVGFSLGLLQLPVLIAAGLIAVQALLLTFIGTSIGRIIGRRWADRAALLSGLVLTLLGLFLLADKALTG